MDVRVESTDGPLVKNVDEALRQVQQQLRDQQEQWVAELRDHPAKLADLEARVRERVTGFDESLNFGMGPCIGCSASGARRP